MAKPDHDTSAPARTNEFEAVASSETLAWRPPLLNAFSTWPIETSMPPEKLRTPAPH
jgi:hypothetical protein